MHFAPAVKLSVGLVGLGACFVILVDILFGYAPNQNVDSRAYMDALAELGARQVVNQLDAADHRSIERALHALRARHAAIFAIGLRDKSGALVASSGPYPASPAANDSGLPALTRTSASIESTHGHWGTAEFLFERTNPQTFEEWMRDRRVWLAIGTALGLCLLVHSYLRRAIIDLDPASVVPERLRTAFDGLSEGVVLLDLRHRVVLANRAFREMASVDMAKIHGRTLLDTARVQLPPGMVAPPWEGVVTTGTRQLGIHVRMGPVHDRRAGHLNCSPITDGRGAVRGCLVTVADMTHVEKANVELAAALRELQATRATARMTEKLRVRQAEREKIATDLHDTLLQGVYGLLLKVQTAINRLPPHTDVRADLEKAVDRTEGLVNEGRDRVAGLRGSGGRYRTLREAIEATVAEFAHDHAASIGVEVEGDARPFPEHVQDELYYIAREALQNCIDHAGATRIRVRLLFNELQFRMRVEDDGCGMDAAFWSAQGLPGHWGVTGMRERAQGVGGALNIVSKGSGTTVDVVLPASAAHLPCEHP